MFDKQYLIDEARSVAVTTLSFVAVDGVAELMNLWNGDLSKASLTALAFILARSLVKAILTMVFPKVFPVRKSL